MFGLFVRGIAWLIGSKAGRYAVAGVAVVAALALAGVHLWVYGRARIRAEIAAEGLKRLQNAIREQDRVAGLSTDERARFVARFLRPD
jgi:hypothetical protein